MKIRKFNESNSIDNLSLKREQVEDIFVSLEDMGLGIKISEATSLFEVKITRLSDSYSCDWKEYSEHSKNLIKEIKTNANISIEIANIISSLDKRKILYDLLIESKTNTDIAYSSNYNIIGKLVGPIMDIRIRVWKDKKF